MPRDLTVRVRADVGDYQKAMGAAATATKDFAKTAGRLQRVGGQMSSVGDSLTKFVTVPIALAGAAALKMASDFDVSFTRMQTLAGVSAAEVDGLKESVLELSGETGKAPQELAEALYFLQSSGLDSAAAMDALEQSAKASAVGLGDTATVADAVSSAMLAYADSGLTAAEATDTLIATARAGKAEPAELASQMGRLLPIASELGITFQDVGGAVAALSQKGNNAEQATTQLVNVMSKLLKPSAQAAQLLDDVGLSADGLRDMLAQKGLLGTLEELRAKLGESGFTKFLEDTQAIQGGLALLGGDLENTKQIFEDVADSAGATDNAFSTWAESMGAKNAQAFAQFQVALIGVGEILAPLASKVLGFVGTLAEAFSSLPEGIQEAIIAFGLFAAALGPLLSVGGRLVTTIGTAMRLATELAPQMVASFSSSTAAAGGLASILGPAGVAGALFAVTAGMGLFLRAKNEARISEATEEFAELKNVSRESASAVLDLSDAVAVSTIDFTAGSSAASEFAESGKLTGEAMADLDSRFDNLLDKAPALAQGFIDNAREIGVSREKLAEWQSALDEQIGAEGEARIAQDEYNDAVAEAAGVTEEATSALQEYSDALRAQFDPLFAVVDASRQLQEANAAVTEAELGVAAAIRDHGAGSLEAAAATQALIDAQLAASGAALDQETAMAALVDMVRQQPGAVDAAKAKLAEWVAQGFITQATADATAAKFDEVTASANSIPVAKNTHVSVTGAEQSINDIARIQERINNLHGRDVGIRIVGTAVGAVGGGVMRFHEGGVVPGRRGEEVAAILQAGETILPLDTPRLMPAPVGAGGGGGGVIVLQINGNGRLAREFSHAVRTGEIQALDGDGRRIRVA